MDNLINNQNINSINPVRPIKSDEKNIFVKQAIGNFWEFIDDTLIDKNFSWQDNIQSQISKIETQTEMYKNVFATPNGNALNLMG